MIVLLFLACAPESLDTAGASCEPLQGVAVDDWDSVPQANILVYAESANDSGAPLSARTDGEGTFSLDLPSGRWELWGEETPGCPGERLAVEVACTNAPIELVVALCG